MAWVLRLVETGIDDPARIIDVMDIRPLGALGDIANLGLRPSKSWRACSKSWSLCKLTITRLYARIAPPAVMLVMSRTGGFIGWRRCWVR
jgi:hypothetical protein